MAEPKPKSDSTVLIAKEGIDSDSGTLNVIITSDIKSKVMRMDFNVPIRWIEFKKIDAIDFANAFLGHIKRLQTAK